MQTVNRIVVGDDRTGEAPTWDARNNRLLWIDAERALIFKLSLPEGHKTVISRGLPVAGIALNRREGLVVAGSTGLHLWRGQDNYRTLVSEHQGEKLNFNDIIADARGRVYAGTYYWGPDGMKKTGKLYLIETDGSVRIVDEGIKLSNGLGFTRNNRILYYADSAERCIYQYEVDPETGELKDKRIFVTVPSVEGIPDGLTVDAEDCVWTAHWYGGQVVRYDPEGKVQRRISLPVKQVSSVAFGGSNLTDLYVTTAGEYWPSLLIPDGFDSKGSQGGSLYQIRLDTPGKIEHQADFRL